MDDATKLAYLKSILGITDTAIDNELNTYLALTAQEIIAWRYSLIGVPENATVPYADEVVQIMACAAGYSHKGAIAESTHNENGTNRTWEYADVCDYIHTHIIPYARLGDRR